jgi:hypothetical protein
MSEFTNTKAKRIIKLMEVSHLLLETGNAHSFIINNQAFIDTVIPTDFITLFDELIREGHEMKNMKVLTNKVLNVFHSSIDSYKRIEPKPDSFLGVLEQNNREMERVLNKIRPVYKAFIKDVNDSMLKTELLELFIRLELFAKHYTIKENVLFPIIEKTWDDYRCIQIMWSFHDDIKRNIKTVIDQLSTVKIDFKLFNRNIGDIFFNMRAIKYREEHILFPYILSTISEGELALMNREGFEMGYPYIKPPKPIIAEDHVILENGLANLGTGTLSIEQIILIFNHLPVDITYVDENDRVLYFSTPKKRIFPRTTAIIGREVSNCHPPESVHVVEQIVQSFKSGEKDKADFWIKMKGEFILIQYFAVRDQQKNYRGVIEVSQEISEIKALEGEKRLLDW